MISYVLNSFNLKMFIKVRNGFLTLNKDKLDFTNRSENKVNITIIYISENIFKISVKNLFLKSNLFPNLQVNSFSNLQVDLKIDEESDPFHLEEMTLFCNNQIIYENIYFLENNSSLVSNNEIIQLLLNYEFPL